MNSKNLPAGSLAQVGSPNCSEAEEEELDLELAELEQSCRHIPIGTDEVPWTSEWLLLEAFLAGHIEDAQDHLAKLVATYEKFFGKEGEVQDNQGGGMGREVPTKQEAEAVAKNLQERGEALLRAHKQGAIVRR